MTGSQEQAAEPVTVFDIVGHKEGYVRYGGAMNGQQSLRKRAGKRRNKGGEGRERVTKHDRCDICRKSYLTMLLMLYYFILFYSLSYSILFYSTYCSEAHGAFFVFVES